MINFECKPSLLRLRERLKSQSQDHFGNVKNQIKQVKEKLWHAEEVSAKSGDNEEVIQLKKELNVLHDKEEKMWQQQSRVQWLKNGDQNTNFFHGTATQRKRKNFIKGLRDGNGVWQEDEEVFSALFNDFYTNLFTSSNPQDLDHVLDGVNVVVTDNMRAEVNISFTSEEVGEAIKGMAPLKPLVRMVCRLYFFRLTGLILVWMFLRLFYLV